MQDVESAVVQAMHALAPGVAVVVIYGSYATARHRADSDVDLAVAFDAPLTLDQRIELQLQLEQRLGRAVDLVDLDQAHGVLLNEILGKGRVIIKNRPAVYARYIARRMYENADFMPHHAQILATRRKRFIDGTPGR